MRHVLGRPAATGIASAGQHVRQLALEQRGFERRVIAVKAVSHDGLEWDAGSLGALDERQGDLRFGVKRLILLAVGQSGSRRVGGHMQRIVVLFIGP
jgi:hypothetical protein